MMEAHNEELILISSDECGQSGGEAEDSDEDVITDYHLIAEEEDDSIDLAMLPRPGGGGVPLPTISVTAHSPASKTYPVLEDSLQHIRELQETIHRMRDSTSAFASTLIKDIKEQNPQSGSNGRLSNSCPTLNEPVLEPDYLGGSLGSSPLHLPPSRKGSGAQDWLCQPETHRRRSWTALEDLTGAKDKVRHVRQRSISLSSMESEADESSIIDPVDGSTIRLLGPEHPSHRRGNRVAVGGASTHSLNEADLQSDFEIIKAKRDAENLRLLPVRLPLQKSISTPSIVAARELAAEAPIVGGATTLPVGSRPSGTESETEEEGSSRRSSHGRFDVRFLVDNIPYDHDSTKRRKRGSLFFRKKKDKNKKAIHQWVSGVFDAAHNCDFCKKPLSNKQQVLFCENCAIAVHRSTCKDNIAECTNPKGKISGKPSFSVPLHKSSISKQGSSGSFSSNSQSGLNSQLLCDDKDNEGQLETVSYSDVDPLVPSEFLSDTPITPAELCSDYSLGLHTSEPDSWTSYVGKDVARKLKEKEVKRQEHIYEFILTEKHHCMTLLLMRKIFVDGLTKYFHLGANLERMFPRLSDLTELHMGLLSRLRQRQREAAIVHTIVDILLDEFSSIKASKLKSAYGEFCSRHRDAVEIYKCHVQNDARFGQFVRHCQTNPLLKKKGIPECILFVTQRLTKYPLLIEPLIKTSKENRREQEDLQRALALVKDILIDVDTQVAEKEKEDRKLEIYNKIDAKSFTAFKDTKFKKSDILQGSRKLRFEGIAMLMQGRGKMQVVLVVMLSDVLFFLQENSNKYTFFTPDSKTGVVSLQKLLVREKAGQESRGIYLISSNPSDPEMFELKVHKPKDKQQWIQAIRSAVENCPDDSDDNLNVDGDDKQSLIAKQNHIRHVVDNKMDIEGLLRQKDIEQALLLEEKIALQLRLLATTGLDPPSPPSYSHLVGENANTTQMWKTVLTAVQEVSQLASSLYVTGTNLSRSVSSVGEHQSDTYVSPILPKRAETFGGYDNANQGPLKLIGKKLQSSGGLSDFDNLKPGDARIFERLPFRNCAILGGDPSQLSANQQYSCIANGNMTDPGAARNDGSTGNEFEGVPPNIPALLSLGREQQYAAVHLSHYVYTLLCIISQLMTTNESLYAQVSTGGRTADGGKQYRHNQQLEELRNLQDKLTAEKALWNAKREQETKDLEEKRAEFIKLQEQVRAEQLDITQQREQLYRKMEVLTSQGLLISPNVALPVSGQFEDSSTMSSEESSPQSDSSNALTGGASSGGSTSCVSQYTSERRKEKWTNKPKSQLPINLISATNQQKVSQLPVKQQIPLKLARLSSGSSPYGTLPMASGNYSGGGGGSSQMLPMKLSQDKSRRSSTGYQRLGSDSFSPPSGETTPIQQSHSRTGSSPAMIQAASVCGLHNNVSTSPTLANVDRQAASKYEHEHYGDQRSQHELPSHLRGDDHRGSNDQTEVIYF